MQEVTTTTFAFPSTSRDVLSEILRVGAQQMLTTAIEAEVRDWIAGHVHLTDERGHRQVVRHGYLPERSITTGVGPVKIRQPRVHDRREGEEREAFSSKILPPYLRKTKSIEELLPWMYLKGISTSDFQEALQALVGPDCPGLSASTVTRLLEGWQAEYHEWSKRPLADKHYVYLWVDGIHFNIRLEEDRQCILVLMGATADGRKELIAIVDGYRESEQSWMELLLDVKSRGLAIDPKVGAMAGSG
jgi:putative transposase